MVNDLNELNLEFAHIDADSIIVVNDFNHGM